MTAEGKIVEVLGPVVDVEFPPDNMPDINYALEIIDKLPEGVPQVPRLVLEVAQAMGNNWVRCISITP
jgi:F-type H+-transporting ATPase subunit beta